MKILLISTLLSLEALQYNEVVIDNARDINIIENYAPTALVYYPDLLVHSSYYLIGYKAPVFIKNIFHKARNSC